MKNTPLLLNAPDEAVRHIIKSDKCLYISFESNEIIYSSKIYCDYIGIVIKGKAVCYSNVISPLQSVTLNTFKKGSVFGMAYAFTSGKSNISCITSEEKCKVIFIKKDLISELYLLFPEIAQNCILFLADRVDFLNKKILTLTAGESVNRLALYILSLYKKSGTEIQLPFSISSLCNVLDIKRASVYRSFNQLEEDGIIKKQGRYIMILDEKALKKYEPDYNENN